MGACYEEAQVVVKEDETLDQVYARFYNDQCWMYGNSGYSGTFAEKFPCEKQPGTWTEENARVAAYENPKWGPAWAFEMEEKDKDGNTVFLLAGWCST